jgi:hypothetical protein
MVKKLKQIRSEIKCSHIFAVMIPLDLYYNGVVHGSIYFVEWISLFTRRFPYATRDFRRQQPMGRIDG